MANRIYYRFEDFKINGVEHWWELIWATDQKKWYHTLYYHGTVDVPTGKRIDGKWVNQGYRTIAHVLIKDVDDKDVDIVKIFKTNKVEKVRMG